MSQQAGGRGLAVSRRGSGGGGGGGTSVAGLREIASGVTNVPAGAGGVAGPYTIQTNERVWLALFVATDPAPGSVAFGGTTPTGVPPAGTVAAFTERLPGVRQMQVTFYNADLVNAYDVEWVLYGAIPGVGPVVGFVLEELPINSDGQTVFTLTQTPTTMGSAALLLWVNGVRYDVTADFTLAGTVLTWLDTDFTLKTTDTLVAYYQA